jgi:hypothetical protein
VEPFDAPWPRPSLVETIPAPLHQPSTAPGAGSPASMLSSSASSGTLATRFKEKGRGIAGPSGVQSLTQRWGRRGGTRSREGAEHVMGNGGRDMGEVAATRGGDGGVVGDDLTSVF